MDRENDVFDFLIDVVSNSKKLDSEKALSKVHKRMALERRRKFLSITYKVAAVLSIPFAVFSAWSAVALFGDREEIPSYIEVRATSGMIAGLTLPDSSKVWLNSGSTLRYPSKFFDTRDVELTGEAYFKVTKDKSRKFHVKTSDMTIEVVGTEFNVDAYDVPGRSSRTTLVNGAINMHYEDASDMSQIVKIYPGQCAVMNLEAKTVTLTAVDPNVASSWRYGKIYLNHTTAAEALRMVENRYNVIFDIKSEKVYGHRFTGQFIDQRLDVVLEHFSRSAGMRFLRKSSEGDAVNGRERIEVYCQ